MILTAMVAMTEARVIGVNNNLPWHLPADLRHFKQCTMGKPVIMGRKTHQAIGKILPGRLNIILSRKMQLADVDAAARVARTPAAALAMVQDVPEAVVIGGAELYQLFLPAVQRIYMTIVRAPISGDAYFPELNMAEWQIVSYIDHLADQRNSYAYSFLVLERCDNSSKI